MEKLYIGTDGEYEESETMLQEPASRGALHGWLWIEIAFRMLAERWGSWLIISVFVFFHAMGIAICRENRFSITVS